MRRSSPSGRRATYWGEPKLRRYVEEFLAAAERDKDDRLEQVARRFLQIVIARRRSTVDRSRSRDELPTITLNIPWIDDVALVDTDVRELRRRQRHLDGLRRAGASDTRRKSFSSLIGRVGIV
jgi:hypothetical protein